VGSPAGVTAATRTFASAASLAEALDALEAGARPIAGGTDLVVGARQGKAPLPDALVAIDRIAELQGIRERDAGLAIGALATHREIASHPVVRQRFTALADASAIVGSHATRSQGTIGGNVMNASPAMETGGPLLCFDAAATLGSVADTRTVSLADLLVAPGATSASPSELLTGIQLPDPGERVGSCYVRLEYRRHMEIAVVAGTAFVVLDGSRVAEARVAITAVAPSVLRVPEAEAALVGSDGDADAIVAAAAAAARAARPIADVRASVEYRRAMTEVMVRRALAGALARARGEMVAVPASSTLYATDGGSG
jgi:CO/xanthine dehydrogenase FAD-binding subunit